MPETDLYRRVGAVCAIPLNQVESVVELLDEGGTVPFIARYRKERTGGLDEVAIQNVRDALEAARELDKRRESILDSLRGRDLLSAELERAVLRSATLAELEDVYLPYRPKKRTRATMARERGLEPLAQAILTGKIDLQVTAAGFVNLELGVPDAQAALAGAQDIIAEQVSEDRRCREGMRRLFAAGGVIASAVRKGKDEEGEKYRDYFDWREAARTAPGHRILAMLRGEREKILSLSLRPDQDQALAGLARLFPVPQGPCGAVVREAVADGYARLLAPSLETELWGELKAKADAEAIGVFAANLRELLLAPPLGPRRILALDPGLRTGAKLVCLDEQGNLLHWQTIFPVGGKGQAEEAGRVVTALVKTHSVQAIAVGNGTGGRETETFVRSLNLPAQVDVILVNEAGASVYSASEIARREFPDLDLTYRGAVSIGRRLMDPLAELVKIDPKSIGVGQYQHDVDQGALKKSLGDVVVSCVNQVGVDVNTASPELLAHVSGLGPVLAANVVEHRRENGPFTDRKGLLKVKRLGPKAFEQCAGFLRIRDGKNPLDGSAIHPERYALVGRMAKDAGCGVAELLNDPEVRRRVDPARYVDAEVGLPTLRDIMVELEKPGRDPRPPFQVFRFADIHDIADLHQGMTVPGIVTNVTRFGAFVDVGVHQDGLVHISNLADRYVRDPSEVVRTGQQVQVTVLEVDVKRRRIGLSMRAI
ncbi:MAG: Tex family protein [Desulfomicrobium sp.]